MAELTLVYSRLENVSAYAKKVSGDCESYQAELKKKLTDQWNSVPSSPLGTGNRRIQSAGYYVEQKKRKLEEKRKAYQAFGNRVNELQEMAKAADQAVAKSVNHSRKVFLKEHENLKGDGWAAFFANLVVNVPVIGWIADKISSDMEKTRDLMTNIRYWYEVSGGKRLIQNALTIGGEILAIIGLATAVLALGGFQLSWEQL